MSKRIAVLVSGGGTNLQAPVSYTHLGGQARLSCGKARGYRRGSDVASRGDIAPPGGALFPAVPAVGANLVPVQADGLQQSLQGLVAQGVEAQLLADGLQHALAPLSMLSLIHI